MDETRLNLLAYFEDAAADEELWPDRSPAELGETVAGLVDVAIDRLAGSAEDWRTVAVGVYREWRRPPPETDRQRAAFDDWVRTLARRVVDRRLDGRPVDREILASRVAWDVSRTMEERPRPYNAHYIRRQIGWRLTDHLRPIVEGDLYAARNHLAICLGSFSTSEREAYYALCREGRGLPAAAFERLAGRLLARVGDDRLGPIVRCVVGRRRRREAVERRGRLEGWFEGEMATLHRAARRFLDGALVGRERTVFVLWFVSMVVEGRGRDYADLSNAQRIRVNRFLVERLGIDRRTRLGRAYTRLIEIEFAPRFRSFLDWVGPRLAA